ncbi:MAG: nucleoside kinase [Clostridia bacterium]|nr:nucleoside kinase [Clostridia bacterium]
MKITYENKEFEVEKGIKVHELLKNEIENAKTEVIACMCNNEVRSLNLELKEDCKLELIDLNSKDGMMIYIRGIMYIMAKALNELYPEALLTVNYQLSNAMFCELDNMKVTDEMIAKIHSRMQEIIDKDIEIRKVKMTKEEAETFYKEKNTLKGRVQIDTEHEYGASLYYCEDYYNYFFGVMPISTGYTKLYDIVKYKDGFIVRYPNWKKPTELSPFVENKKLLATLDEYEDIYKLIGINTIYKLNREAKRDGATDAILLSEALHEKKIAGLADNIAKNKEVKVVLIAGPSSSGKTTFAKRLGMQLRLNGIKPVTISVDNYFVEREQNPKDEFGNYDFECIEALDTKLFNEHLVKLLNGEEIEVPTFDFTVGTKRYNGETMKLEPDEILVIEGIHCLNDKLTSSIPKEQKYKIYISALTVLNIDYYNRISTTDTRLIRRIVRDNQYRGYSAKHTIKMWYSVNRGEEKYIYPYQEEADSMFNSSLIYELGVLKDYALPLLKEIKNTEPEYAEACRLVRLLTYFEPIPVDNISKTSLIREFIGGSLLAD